MDKRTTTLLAALKQALLEPGEQRLYRSGKLPGLFARRTGVAGDAAELALGDGLLEVVQTDAKGKKTTQWVRATAKAVDYIYERESPATALKDLQHILQTTQMCIPVWLADIHKKVESLTGEVAAEMRQVAGRLDLLSRRVEEAIARAESARPSLPEKLAESVPWAGTALTFLNRRLENRMESPCSMSELFAAVKENHPEQTISDFHAGLRRLFDRGLIRLLPIEGDQTLPEPEYALLDGLFTYYYVSRSGNLAA